jgi:periplasmic protein TonB
MLSLLIALAAVQTAPPPPLGAPNPMGASLATLVSADDYPPEAVANDWGGTVRIKLEISNTGDVSGCHILRSSGHVVLDAKTCEIMVKRARFKPARNASGKAVSDTVEQTIHWALEDPEPEVPTEPKP